MKRLIYYFLLSLIITNTFIFQRTNLEKIKVINLLEYYSTIIEYDLKTKGEINYISEILLEKNNIIFFLEENKSEKIIFSLKTMYFSYFANKYKEIKNYYLINFK